MCTVQYSRQQLLLRVRGKDDLGHHGVCVCVAAAAPCKSRFAALCSRPLSWNVSLEMKLKSSFVVQQNNSSEAGQHTHAARELPENYPIRVHCDNLTAPFNFVHLCRGTEFAASSLQRRAPAMVATLRVTARSTQLQIPQHVWLHRGGGGQPVF